MNAVAATANNLAKPRHASAPDGTLDPLSQFPSNGTAETVEGYLSAQELERKKQFPRMIRVRIVWQFAKGIDADIICDNATVADVAVA